MSENVRALIVIWALSITFFGLARNQVCHLAVERNDFSRRCYLWLLVASIYFLSNNFWIFLVLSSVAILVASARDSNKFALYLMMLYAAPLVSNEVPFFGVLNYLFAIDYTKMLSILILMPLFFKLMHDPETKPLGESLVDKFVLSFITLPLILQGLEDTLTNTLRQAFISFIELFLPYYVASRSMNNLRACRDIVMSFTIGILVLSPLALFEYVRKWLLYASVPSSMGLNIGAFYLGRGDSLRAMTSAGHALVLAYLMVIASGLYVYSRRFIPSKNFIILGLLALLAGLWAPLSRGPWLGALLVLAVIYATGANPLGRTVKLLLMCFPIVVVILISPAGEKILPLIPFIGEFTDIRPEDDFNQVYRQRLLEVSLGVVANYPFFGSFHFRDLPIMQSLVQGQGIIDIVNAYLMVALNYGLVGLFFYLGMFFTAIRSVWIGYKSCSSGEELHTLGRAFLAIILGVIFTISGVGGSFSIGTINMLVVGLCVGYGDFVIRYRQAMLKSPPVQSPLR